MTTPYRVQIRLRITSVSTGVPVVLEWSQSSNNWGTAIETDGRDWPTTNDTTEESLTCDTANVYKYWEIDPSLLDFTQILYVRLRDTTENSTNTRNCAVGSQNNTTVDYRPQCIITFANPSGGPPLRMMMGLGI